MTSIRLDVVALLFCIAIDSQTIKQNCLLWVLVFGMTKLFQLWSVHKSTTELVLETIANAFILFSIYYTKDVIIVIFC